MKMIPLTQDKYTAVDDEDYEVLMKNRWCYHGGYAVRGQRQGKIVRLIRMHNFLMNTPPKMVTDHINGDRLDNQRANLRICSHAENQRNRGMNLNNTSGYKGVIQASKHPRVKTKRWVAQIKVNYKTIRLGYFVTPEEAALAYNKAALEHFGEYAYQNTIEV